MNVVNTYIILVNYNNWRDTIECLESILKSNVKDFNIIIVDNNSTDNSIEYIDMWASGYVNIWLPSNNLVKKWSFPPIKKPIQLKIVENDLHTSIENNFDEFGNIILIKHEINGGFGAGNNVALKWLFKIKNYKYVWLLNNDTVIENNSLENLVKKMDSAPEIGFCGSTLFYYNTVRIQTLGGAKFNYYLGLSQNIISDSFDSIKESEIEKKLDYIAGASLFMSKEAIINAGLFDEKMFMYYEEVDLKERNNNMFKLGYCKNSIIYHKEGGSSGVSKKIKDKSYFADYHSFSSRIYYFKKYYPSRLIIIYLMGVVYIVFRILNFRFKNALSIIKAVMNL